MAGSDVSVSNSERYPGPSRAELGSLAEWVSETEFSNLHESPRPARAPAAVPAPRPAHRRRQGRSSRPGPEAFGDPAVGQGSPESAVTSEGTVDFPAATSLRAIESELWVSEACVGAGLSPPERARLPASPAEEDARDSFLDQLEEIEEELRKRPRD